MVLKGLVRKALPLALVVSNILATPVKADDLEIKCNTPVQCFSIGAIKYERGDLDSAARYFARSWGLSQKQDAYNIYARGLLLYNIGIVYEQGGEPEKAISYFGLYMEEISRIKDSKRKLKREQDIPEREDMEKRIAFLKKYAGGNKALRDGKYDQAIVLYQEAFSGLEHLRPLLSREMGQAYEISGNYQEAILRYRFYLEGSPDASDKAEIERRIAKIEADLPEPVPLVPIPLPKANPQQDAHPSATKPIQPQEHLVPIPAPLEERPPFYNKHIASISAAAAAVALGVTGLVFNSSANSRYEELANSCGRTRRGCSEGDIQDVEGDMRIRNISYTGALVAGAVALGLFVLESHGKQKANKTTPPIRIKPQGLEASF